jgi:hypothetical protein
MIKKIIIGIALLPVCLYAGLWIFAKTLHASSDSRQWPQSLGVLADSPKRYPDAENNSAANTLATLTLPIGIDITPREKKLHGGYEDAKRSFSDYITVQLEQASDQSAAPPADVAAFLFAHQAQIEQVREHIATAGPIRWQMHVGRGFDAPIPNLLGYMSLTKLFTARALAKAANHDATAWDDLHATWLLDRELWNRPELISQLIALAGTRMVNAAAVKMPLPEPAWFDELQKHDYRRDFARAFQSESANWKIMFKNDLHKHMIENSLMYPYIDACLVDGTEQMRVETARMASQTGCDLSHVRPITLSQWNLLSQIAFPSLTAVWQRAYRFEAEREATDKVLALRRGETPSTSTVCSDGKWIVEANRVKFDRAIPINAGIRYPLAYEVTR